MIADAIQVVQGKEITPDRQWIRGCFNLVMLLAVGFLSLTTPTDIAASDKLATDSEIIRIELNDGLLTAEFHDVPLPRALNEIGKLAGFKVVQVADFDDFPRISNKFEKLPVQEAVERLVANTNRIFFYSPSEVSESQRTLSQLWLLGPGEAGSDITQHSEAIGDLQHEEPVVRSQAALRLVQQQGDEEAVVDKLAILLQTDQDPLVRSRVAIALGALGDESAVSELESALLDPNFSVRAQSMTALGQIGGDKATMALGGILLNESLDSVERVIAAQALWKQDSESAQNYLQAGSSDANEQVRDASSKAPVSMTPGTGSQSGPEATE
jgi:hypothetical protein